MNRTKIPWCDWTWNPIVGCSPASDGCANCYAAAISQRFRLPWGQAYFMQDRLDQPEKVRKPGRVFVCSMADIGHETVQPEWRCLVFRAMQKAPWHTYIVLTKRPGPWLGDLPVRCWAGVSCETQHTTDRVSKLLWYTRRAAVRYVSVEPMLEPVSLACYQQGLSWVIAGPETGAKARRCEDAWIEALAAESPCFFDKRKNGARREFPTQNAPHQARAVASRPECGCSQFSSKGGGA